MKYLKSYKLFESDSYIEVRESIDYILINLRDEGIEYDIVEYPKIGMFEITIYEVENSLVNSEIKRLLGYVSEEGYKSFVGKHIPVENSNESRDMMIVSLLKPNDLTDKLEKYFLDTINSCVVKTSKDFPDDRFWVNKEGTIIFRQDPKNGYFWCKYDPFWSFFSKTNHLQTQEIQVFMKYLLGQHLKLEGLTPTVPLTRTTAINWDNISN